MTAGEILPELLEDKDFFETSGGGVTLSGGEVMLQADGAAELASALASEGVQTLIDTAGCVPYSEFEKLRGTVAGFLYDFKSADHAKYESIGGRLDTVADNLWRLMADGESVRVRVPLIPGFNANAEDILGICRYLSCMGVTAVDILPFHRLGTSKYEAMGLEYTYRDTQPMSRDALQDAESAFKDFFDSVTLYK